MKILIVGSNPSMKSPDLTPFHPSTKSSQILQQWFTGINAVFSYVNLVDYQTENNRPLRVAEIKRCIPDLISKIELHEGYKIVGLGKTVAKALSMTRFNFFEAPHPSGLNRKLNDKEYVKGMVDELLTYINS